MVWGTQPDSKWSGSLRPRPRLQQAAGGPSGPRSPHILASPPGTAAPLDAINYTPKTNQIHPRGQLAPVDELNYSLLPASGGGMGMGAGATGMPSPPTMPGQERLVGRYAPPASMAAGTYQPGTPPMRPSPYSTGPGPRSAPSGPSPAAFSGRSSMMGTARGWGAGHGGFGAGQASDLTDLQLQAMEKLRNGEVLTDEEQAAIDDLEGGLSDPGSATQQQTQTTQTQTQAPAQDQSGGQAAPNDETQALTLAPTATGQPGENAPAGWHTEGGQNDRPGHPTQLWWVSNDGKKRLFMGTYQATAPGQPDRFIHAQAADQQQLSVGIDFTKAKTQPNLVRQTLYNPDTKQNEVYLIDPKTGKKINPQTGQPDDNAPSIGPASKTTSTASTKPTAQKVQVIPGVGVLVEDAQGHMVLDQAKTDAYNQAQAAKGDATQTEQVRAQAQLATDKPYTTFVAKDGATWLFDSETGDSYPITAADPLNGIFTVGNQLVQVDPTSGQANVTYTAPHNWSVTTSGGRTIAYDPQDPTNHQDIAVDETAQQTAAVGLDQAKANLAKTQQDLLTGKISAEDARAKLAIQAHDLLHPQSTIVGGNIYTPSGAELDINYASIPGMPQRPSKHVSGGPLDAESAAAAKHITDFLDKLDQGQTDQAQQSGIATPAKAQAPAQQQDTGASQALQNLETQVLQAGDAGVPGKDPNLMGQAQPPHNVTTAAGDIAHYDAGGSLTGIDYRNTAPPHYGEPGYPGSEGDGGVGSTLDVGVTSDSGGGTFAGNEARMGGGQDSFMGRGLTPATGRGSTGIGWSPQLTRGWQPTGAGQEGPQPPPGAPSPGAPTPGPGDQPAGGAGEQMVQTTDGKMHPISETMMTVYGRLWKGPSAGGGQPQQPGAAAGPQQPGGQTADPSALIQWLHEQNQRLATMGQRFGIGGGGGGSGSGAGQDETMPQAAAGGPPAAPSPGGSPPGASAGWTPPVPPQAVAGIGHRFGQSMDVGEPQHSGVDLQAPEGTPTVSPVTGLVEQVEHNPQGLGLTVIIRGKDGSEHRLGHLSRTDAYPGMQVVQGQDLQSHVGSSGNTTGAHLHWGVRDGQGQPQDPTAALGPMGNLPPVPGTQQMGPPGGTPGPGGPPPGGPPAAPPSQGAGQQEDPNRPGWSLPLPAPGQLGASADLLRYKLGGSTNPSPGSVALTSPMGRVQIDPMEAFGAGQDSSSPDYQAGYQAGLQASKSPGTPPVFVPAMQQPIPSASDSSGGDGGMGGGQESMDSRWDLYEAKDTSGFWGPPGAPDLGSGADDGSYALPPGFPNPNLKPGDLAPVSQVDLNYDPSVTRVQRGLQPAADRPNVQLPIDVWWPAPPVQPGVGSGGEGGMGAGGVYVKMPDGSMHWDETKADPNPNGGSVIDSGGNVIPGANRQSGPTGPGGTGPAGSQAQAAHAAELQANPTFASTPSSPFLSNAWQTMGANYGQPSAYGQFAGALPGPPGPDGSVVGSAGSALSSGLSSQIDPLSTIQSQVDPFGWNKDILSARFDPTKTAFDPTKGTFDKTGKPTTGIGSTLNVGLTPTGKPLGTGGEAGMGAGAAVSVTPDTQATIDAQVQVAQMQVNEQIQAAQMQQQTAMAQVNANIAAENDRHAEAIANFQQQAAFHQDDVALKQQEDQENQRHNQVTEQLQAQATQMQQTVESMREANSVQLQQMQEGTQVYLQQGDQAFKDWQTTQADRMSILSSALSNPWLQQLTGMSPAQAGASTGGQNISNLINQILQPYNAQAYGMQNAPSAMNAPSTAGGVAPGATGSQPTAAQMGMQSSDQGGTPSWSQWQGWNPFQMAAYRTNIEALGPGAWNQAQQGMQNTFAAQGGNPNITQMQAAAATPEQSAGQQMTANVFGQTVPEWQQQQSKQWSQAQAPQVKSNLTGIAA